MTLLGAIATTGATPQQSAPPVDPEAASVPYLMPGRPPFNAPVKMPMRVVSNSPDLCTHPSVWDFGPGRKWNGYRYWMAVTDYGGQHLGENPNIQASNDAFNFAPPPGITNPIWTVATQNAAAGTTPLVADPVRQWNSDTELQYDESTDRLVCFWREMAEGSTGPERLWSSSSKDGVTWDTPVIRLDTKAGANTSMSMISPGIVKVGETDWRMFCPSFAATVRTSTSMYGPWSAPKPIKLPKPAWHWAVVYHDGIFYAAGGDPLMGYTSRDGVTWSASLLLDKGSWDKAFYRPCLRAHPDGEHFRVWYSVQSDNWWLGYTVIPRSAWPAPPA